ncbi:MAG: hypothetical protein Fur0032_03620 [Terrimicrobiaceae bacterium]
MKLRRSPGPHPTLMLVVPAIQLPLLLLFFILLGASFLLQPGVTVTVPDSPFILSAAREPSIVSVPAPPASSIYFGNRQTDIEGFRSALEPLRGRPRTIVIRADRLAPYDRVTAVMNIALELGFPVVLAASEQPDSP